MSAAEEGANRVLRRLTRADQERIGAHVALSFASLLANLKVVPSEVESSHGRLHSFAESP
jgi:hypothetical protein